MTGWENTKIVRKATQSKTDQQFQSQMYQNLPLCSQLTYQSGHVQYNVKTISTDVGW